jgi:hypothetical protein
MFIICWQLYFSTVKNKLKIVNVQTQIHILCFYSTLTINTSHRELILSRKRIVTLLQNKRIDRRLSLEEEPRLYSYEKKIWIYIYRERKSLEVRKIFQIITSNPFNDFQVIKIFINKT